MQIPKIIRDRRSVRAYRKKDIPQDVLRSVLEAARLAPSANNRQPWKFIVVRDKAKRKALAKAAKEQQFVAEAPVVIASVALEPERLMTCGVSAASVDLSIATDHIQLAAVEHGLGSCWLGAFYQEDVKKILGIPAKYKVIALLSLGYPADQPGIKNRKAIEEIITYDEWE
ncbi:nitroreductase [candidate division WOR-3 bacterium]|uniref:Nitroreductase n=1 Tax=candidate division WOR-3 bacterium TaxID=2052148 RepID=A0A9D5K7K7_UNCW3|nr:nitroreductase [candidate division WOR-3 bacterium]MBD3363742.1 nitroreductase [candidate division WOR-3 bacterium]